MTLDGVEYYAPEIGAGIGIPLVAIPAAADGPAFATNAMVVVGTACLTIAIAAAIVRRRQ